METEDIEQAAEHDRPIRITVTVNERPVTFTERRVSGLQIKQAAIEQGVNIRVDFVLYIVRGPGHLHPVADHEVVNLTEHERFRATAPDDNS